MQELVDTQRSYQDTLRTTLSEQQLQRQLIQQLLPPRPLQVQAIPSIFFKYYTYLSGDFIKILVTFLE